MSSVVLKHTRQRANANGYASPPLEQQQQSDKTPPTSPEATKLQQERRKKRRPQISVERANDRAKLSGADSNHALQDILPLRSAKDSSDLYQGSSVSSDPVTSPDHHNGEEAVESPIELVDSHLTVQPRGKKSHTLPTDITCAEYLPSGCNLQSSQSSRYNSSDGDSDDTPFQNPRRLLQDEKYWPTSATNLLLHLDSDPRNVSTSVRKVTRQGRIGRSGEVYEEDYLSNSDNDGSAEDEESMVSAAPSFVRHSPHRPDDDDVFQSDFCSDVCFEADTKLVDWSYNVFVPACRTLLFHCRDGDSSELSSSQILADLRSLSNTISFFCSEQQQLSNRGASAAATAASASGGNSGNRRQGISASISTDRISRIRDMAKTQSSYSKIDNGMIGDLAVKTTAISSLSQSHSSSGNGIGSDNQDGMYDRNYSVKILRSVSQSLIAPLVKEAEEGFTPELYKSIVQAVQKIAWKVEACLAINDPSKETDVYLKIFDLEQQENLVEKMINALPPEEPKLGGGGRTSRSSSISSSTRQGISAPSRSGRSSVGTDLDLKQGGGNDIDECSDTLMLSPSKVVMRGAVDAIGAGSLAVGCSRDSANSLDLTVSGSSDNTCVSSSFLDSISTTTSGGDTRRSMLSSVGADFPGDWAKCTSDMPAIRRGRMATFASPSRGSKAWRSFDQDRGDDYQCQLEDPTSVISNDQCCLDDGTEEPHYFRPKHVRRTTVSLSRREVSKLGWKKNRRVEKSASALSSTTGSVVDDRASQDFKNTPERNNTISEGSASSSSLAKMKRLHTSRNTSFSRLSEELGPSSAETFRTKSASMSDLLDESPSLPGKSPRPGVKDTAAAAAVVAGSTAGVPKRRKSRNHSYDSCIEGDERESEGGTPTLNHQSSSESTTVGEHLARSYLPINKQASLPGGTSATIEEDWTLVGQDPSQSLDSSKRFRSASRNSKIIIGHAAKTLTKKARKAVVQKSLSASEKFTNKVIKTANALRRGSISNFTKGRRDDSLVAVSASTSIEELQEVERELPLVPGNLPPRPGSTSERGSPKMKKSGTLPGSKRSTVSRLSNKNRTRTLGTASNSLTRKSKKTPQHKGAGFVSNTQVAPAEQAALTESIYHFSKNAVQPSLEDAEDQLLISVELAGKGSRLYRKRSSIISTSGSSSSILYEITVATNIKKFGRRHYNIVRNLKQINYLYDCLVEDCAGTDIILPERPDKKMSDKVQKEKVESFMAHIATTPFLHSSQPATDFLMPDEGFGSGGNSETKLDLLMTFYTPDVYPGPPGSHHDIQLVSHDDVPDSASPALRHRHASGQKKGTLRLVKNQEASSTFVIKEEGQDALIVLYEEDRYVVVAGTFEKLVEQLACEENPDARFVMTFLLGYRHFATPADLLTLLLRRFHMTLAPNPTEEEVAYAEKWRYVIQLRVLDVVMYWLRKCWPDFCRLPVMLDRIQEFVEELKASTDTNFQLAGKTLEKMLSEKMSLNSAQYRISTVSNDTTDSTSSSIPTTPSHFQSTPSNSDHASPGPSHSSPVPGLPSPGPYHEGEGGAVEQKSRPHKSNARINIHTLPAIQLARQLTLVELDFLKAIDIHEMVVYVWESNTAVNKPYRRHIDEYIGRFNKLSYWVSSEICSTQDPHMRGTLIEKFVEVAKYCQDCKNFNCTISIVSGLSLMAVRRLKKSWEFVSDKSVKTFHKMCLIMSPTNNHSAYRKLFNSSSRKNCIPYFGVFMRDITFFNDGNHKKLKNGLLNFSKLRSMVCKFEELKLYQRSNFRFIPDDKLQEYCRNLWCLSEQDLYEASEQLEPREVALPTPSTPDTSQQFDETDV